MKLIAPNLPVTILFAWLAIALAPLVGPQTAAADDTIAVAENPASADASLKYLPDDWTALAKADVKTVMKLLNSDAVRNSNPQSAQFSQIIQAAKLMTGIDFENDVDSLVTFLAGDLEDKRWLMVLQGTFDNDTVENTLAGSVFTANFKKTTYKSQTIYTGGDAAYYLPAASTIVAGVPYLVRGAIDKLEAKAEPSLPESLQGLLDRTHGDSTVWAAVRPAPLLNSDAAADWRANNADLAAKLGKVEAMSISYDLAADGLKIHALNYLGSDANAKELYGYLEERRDALLKVEGTNVFLCSLLIASDLTSDGPYTLGTVRFTLPALADLWNSKVIVKPE